MSLSRCDEKRCFWFCTKCVVLPAWFEVPLRFCYVQKPRLLFERLVKGGLLGALASVMFEELNLRAAMSLKSFSERLLW